MLKKILALVSLSLLSISMTYGSVIYTTRIDVVYGSGESVYVEGYFGGGYLDGVSGNVDLDCVEWMNAPCATGMEFDINGAPPEVSLVFPPTGGWGDLIWRLENGAPKEVLSFSGFQSIELVAYPGGIETWESGRCTFDMRAMECSTQNYSWGSEFISMNVSIYPDPPSEVPAPDLVWLFVSALLGLGIYRKLA